jgi:hypothetical protein
LISEFKLDNSGYQVPLLFGSIVGDWNKVVPLMFLKHYALNFVLPKNIYEQQALEMRKVIFDTAKYSCQLRVDTYDSYKRDFDAIKVIENNASNENKTTVGRPKFFDVNKYGSTPNKKHMDETFAFAAFTTPGLHQVFIFDPLNGKIWYKTVCLPVYKEAAKPETVLLPEQEAVTSPNLKAI